uniref:Uncharacterized protein n=3 Tax=Paenarthrobacter TaxID=1742992 RepID=Q8GAD5_PAENI|nr:hypothetical protein [Paenarthrobacter nicotinovorans]
MNEPRTHGANSGQPYQEGSGRACHKREGWCHIDNIAWESRRTSWRAGRELSLSSQQPHGTRTGRVQLNRFLEQWTLNATWQHGLRHADSFSVNKSPTGGAGDARFNSVDSCKQNSDRPHVAPTMNQLQPLVVRDSKDLTMSAVINRGGGRPSKGLRKYIGFRTPAKTAEDVHMIAAAKGMTVTDYVASAVDRSLREDLALLDQFTQQDELPIRMAS